MDIDSEINAALDIPAEFCTQVNKENGTGSGYTSSMNNQLKVKLKLLKNN